MPFWKVSRVPALLRSVCLPFELFARADALRVRSRADAVIIARGRFAFPGFRLSAAFARSHFWRGFALFGFRLFWRGCPLWLFSLHRFRRFPFGRGLPVVGVAFSPFGSFAGFERLPVVRLSRFIYSGAASDAFRVPFLALYLPIKGGYIMRWLFFLMRLYNRLLWKNKACFMRSPFPLLPE